MASKIAFFLLIFSIFISCETEDHPQDPVIFFDRITAVNHKIIKNAEISLFVNNTRFSTVTDKNGNYKLLVPSHFFSESGFISLTISHPDYKPTNVVYKLPLKPNKIYNSNGVGQKLTLCPNCLSFTEINYSELFHLGDNNYSGSINSQFQKSSDGLDLTFNFTNSKEYKKLKINFSAKGIESKTLLSPDVIEFDLDNLVINLANSPNDGSFGNYNFEIENKLPYSQITFRTAINNSRTIDMDDWEFCSLSIEGIKE